MSQPLEKLLLEHPLLLHAEVVGGGQECLEELEKLVANGTVGHRTLKPGVKESTVYWRKKLKDEDKTPKLLRKRRPRFVSPLASTGTSKRPRLTPSTDTPHTPGDTSPPTPSCQGGGETQDMQKLKLEIKSLEKKLKEEEEKLRKLKMVKLYRSKNDLEQLDQLIDKWRGVSQETAELLLTNSNREPRPTMTEMLSYLHIDTTLIRYSPEQESFY